MTFKEVNERQFSNIIKRGYIRKPIKFAILAGDHDFLQNDNNSSKLYFVYTGTEDVSVYSEEKYKNIESLVMQTYIFYMMNRPHERLLRSKDNVNFDNLVSHLKKKHELNFVVNEEIIADDGDKLDIPSTVEGKKEATKKIKKWSLKGRIAKLLNRNKKK